MNKSKIDFIAALLNDKRIKSSDREKLFNMSMGELKSRDEQIMKGLEEIKGMVGGGNGHNKNYVPTANDDELVGFGNGMAGMEDELPDMELDFGDENEHAFEMRKQEQRRSLSEGKKQNGAKNGDIIEHRFLSPQVIPGSDKYRKKPVPAETKSFLTLFQNSSGLKYLTHRFNGKNPEYSSFIYLCKVEFNNAKNKYLNVPDVLLDRIQNFAFNTEPKWTIRNGNDEHVVNYGWSSEEFRIWYENNKIHPSDSSKWNKEMIEPFKNTIEVRTGNLPEIINHAIDLVDPEKLLEIEAIRLEDAEFYTDVDSLSLAIFRIIAMIKEWANRNFNYKVIIEYYNHTISGGRYKEIRIIHKNSKSNKMADDPSFAKGDLIDIRTTLFGLCNFEINAEFVDGTRNKIILTDETKKINKTYPLAATDVIGFTYVLKFY